jgi:glucose uptake protein GlcU
MGALATAGILKEFKKPITIMVTVLLILLVVVIIRFMNRNKRQARQKAKALESELTFQAEKDKTVYQSAANTFEIDESTARICDQIAMAVNGAFGSGMFGNDNEATIIQQLNRLGGIKSIKCADFFYKKYSKKVNPNIAFDAIGTLNVMEWKQIKEFLKEPLISYAKIKGVPNRDIYF